MKVCPVCKGETSDMRHVSVECFAELNEPSRLFNESHVLKPVPLTSNNLGRQVRIVEGYKSKNVHLPPIPSDNLQCTRLILEWEKMPEMKTIIQTLYRKDCCKSCRGDFIKLFREWALGKHLGE